MIPQQLPMALIYSSLSPVRELQPDAVATLRRSLERLGLRIPITVRSAIRVRDGRDADVWEIVSGRHRVEAARKLGWSEIAAVVSDGDDVNDRLWEIAENLHRAELTVQERADHIAEWVRLTGEKEVLPQVGAKLNVGRPESGVRAASRDLGIGREEARRAVKIDSMTPEAKAAAAADPKLANNQAALLRVAAEPSAERQLARIRDEQEQVEAHAANRETNRVIALTEAEQFASWIMASADLDELPKIIAWVEGVKPKDLTAALRRVKSSTN